jgi:adenylate cyclase
LERKLTAILCADVFGYSRLMGEDEEATLGTLSSHRKLVDSLIEQHRGRFVNSAGDSVLAEFASVVNAVQCAVEIQTTLKTENVNLPPERRMEFRIGVNLGDVMVDGEQIYGDGVNVAARLESLAEPGGICLSGTVHEQVRDKLALRYEDAGEQEVKNIARPVRVLRVMLEGGATTRTPAKAPQRPLRKHWRGGVFSLAGLALIAAVIVFVQHLSLRPSNTTASIPTAPTPALTLPDKPSIAVLPFTNLSGDPQEEYFSDGITGDIITALSRSPDLFVIDRASAFAYKGKPIRVEQVSRELGVKYVLEGGVQKAAGQLRVTAQLVDATTGAELWAENYDRPLHDVFSVQDELVRRIVTTMGLQLVLWDRTGLQRLKGTDSLEAYDYDLRGWQYFYTQTREGFPKARKMWEKAIELDPKYAEAYAGVGETYFFEAVFFQSSGSSQALDQAYQWAQKAIALNDSEPQAYMLLGNLDVTKRRYDQAISEAQRAVTLAPNSSDGYVWLARILNFSGRPTEALVAAEKGMRLNPRHPEYCLIMVAGAYMSMGRFEEARSTFEQALATQPNDPAMPMWLAVVDVELGRNDDARAEAAEVLRLSPHYSLATWRQVYQNKDPAVPERWLADLRKAGLK